MFDVAKDLDKRVIIGTVEIVNGALSILVVYLCFTSHWLFYTLFYLSNKSAVL